MSSHAARIALLHSVKATGRITESAVGECVLSLARNGDIVDAMRMINRYQLPHLSTHVIHGVSENGSGRMAQKFLTEFVNPQSLSIRDVENLMKIFSVHGIHPRHVFRDHLIDLAKEAVKKDSTYAPLVIACLRRVREERKFLWDLFSSVDNAHGADMTAHIAQVAGINGWGEDRVKLILSRRSCPLSDLSASMLIKAVSHYPGTGSLSLVDEIIAATQNPKLNEEPLVSAIVAFHAVNKQFDKIEDLVRSSVKPKFSPCIFHTVLRHTSSDETNFFRFYSLMTDEFRIKPTPKIVQTGIDLALSTKSAKLLVHIRQSAHVAGIHLEDSQMKRLVSLTNSFQVPVRVRRRIRETIKLIDPGFIS